MHYMDYIALAAGIALLIMSGVIRGSAAKLSDSTEKTNISRTSNILLIISLIVTAVSGMKVYALMKPVPAPVASTAFAYYF